MKKKSICWIVILLIAVMLVGCSTSQNTQVPNTEVPAIETAAPTEAPTEASTEAAPEESEEDIVYEGDASSYYIDVVYAEQIGRYHTALTEKWDEGKYFENGLSALPFYYYEGNPLENVGFGFADLDNDGYWELIIGGILNSETDPTVFEIWTLTEEGPVMLAQSGYRNRYCLVYDQENNAWFVANEGSNSAANSASYYLALQDGSFKVVQGIVFDAIADEKAPWFMAYDLDWDTTNDTPIDEETALAIMDAYRADYTVVEYFPYSLYK